MDVFLILDIVRVTFVTVPIVGLPTSSQLSGYGHASENEQCNKAHALSIPAVGIYKTRPEGNKWKGPLAELGSRGEAIHA